MAYTTAAKVRAKARQISSRIRKDADITAEIADVDAYIDDRLRGRYATPFATVPSLIEQISRILTAIRIVEEVTAETQLGESTYAERQEERAEGWLDKIADGSIELSVDAIDDLDAEMPSLQPLQRSGWRNSNRHVT